MTHAIALALEVSAGLGMAVSVVGGNLFAFKMRRQNERLRKRKTGWRQSFKYENFTKTHKSFFPESQLPRNYTIAIVIGMVSILLFGITQTLQH
jgi:ABC-type lipoprotein release transport system permease subunit